jgi:D-alanyl-D-alanine carboxypeptidase/D-alanyl-D-alanine endopeptidase (penicillin-binding protein 7)
MLKKLAVCLSVFCAVSATALPFGAQHAIVVNDDSGAVLLEKNAGTVVPIASLTKLMTAMVILDSKPNMEESISIQEEDMDLLKHSKSRVPVGSTLPRKDVLQLALMSSDNRAAASLARTYPGGHPAFAQAVARKIQALGMSHTTIKEPTGLNPENTSTAADLAKMALAASKYREITNITTDSGEEIKVKGRSVAFRNTNRLVGKSGWDISLSKTGFINEAGHCLIMRIKQDGKNATLVLLNAPGGGSTFADARNIRQFLTGKPAAPTRVAKSRSRMKAAVADGSHKRRHHRHA